MATVDVSGETYNVYADLDAANLYLGAAFHADSWAALDDDAKGKALVTATRTLDRQSWKGDKTDTAQALAWPRTGTNIDGVEDDIVPTDIINASIEMALALVDGSDLQNEQNSANKISSMSAGSVSLTYYRGADGSTQRFPQIIMELAGKYLLGTGSKIGGVISSGTCGESVTDTDFGFTRGF